MTDSLKTKVTRRALLQGTGAVAIALPALEVSSRHADAQESDPPERLVSVFFGQGLPPEMFEQPGGGGAPVFSGPLAPLAPFAEDLALVRNLRHVPATGDPHDVGPLSAFTGFGPNGATAGGPSIDQVALEALHPQGVPTRIPTLAAGGFHREGGFKRHVRCWKSDLSPAALPQESPTELFRQLFGQAEPTAPDPALEKRALYRRSVLDAVRGSYQHALGAASPYGRSSKQRIEEHLERVRELEVRVATLTPVTCKTPQPPGNLGAEKGQTDERRGGGSGGVSLVAPEWNAVIRTQIELFVLALRCDITRFGNMIFQSGGDRVRLSGEYRYKGELITDFNDDETSHEYFHAWRTPQAEALVRNHLHFMLGQVAYLLEQLKAQESAPGAGNLLDESLVMITTELGDSATHSYRGVFHALSGASNRLKTGVVLDAGGDYGPSLYNACLKGIGVNTKMGDPRVRDEELSAILV